VSYCKTATTYMFAQHYEANLTLTLWPQLRTASCPWPSCLLTYLSPPTSHNLSDPTPHCLLDHRPVLESPQSVCAQAARQAEVTASAGGKMAASAGSLVASHGPDECIFCKVRSRGGAQEISAPLWSCTCANGDVSMLSKSTPLSSGVPH
jgi:hypothetical protein